MKNNDLLNAILKEEKKEELKKKNIVIKNNSFSLSSSQKSRLEKELEHSFKKVYFTEKNLFLFNAVKEKMEQLGYSFLTEEELEKELEKIG